MKTFIFALALLSSTSTFAAENDKVCDALEEKVNRVSALMAKCDSKQIICNEVDMEEMNADLGDLYEKMLKNGCAEDPSVMQKK